MFKENMKTIIDTFYEFRGSGMYLALFFIAMLYLYFKEDNKKIKNLLLYFPIAILLLTLNPIFNEIIGGVFKPNVYWRVFWMLPVGITIAYAVVKFVNQMQDKKEKIIVLITFIVIIIMSGKFIYTEENFDKVGNLYKLPDESVLVAQLIGVDNEEYKKAIVPFTIVAHIRQVDASILLAYPRTPGGYDKIDIVQHLNSGNVVGVVGYAAEENCNYVVYHKATVLVGKMEDYGFEKINETPNYAIYKLVNEELLK